MTPDGPRIPKDLVKVAELAAAVPDREEELLQRGFEMLSDALPSSLAAFLELDGPSLVVRTAIGEGLPGGMVKHKIALEQLTGIRKVIDDRECHVIEEDALRAEACSALGDPEILDATGETLLVPVAAGEEIMGLLLFHNPGDPAYSGPALRIATLCGSLVGLGMLAIRQAEEVEQYRETLEERNRLLVEEVAAETDACRALERSESRIMRRLVRMAKQVAVTEAPVLITGETGTGKEVVARAIHAWSERSTGPFVQLNCAALPENIVESELFGHTRGAFSGATENRPGRFRIADAGTLLLDEIGDLPAQVQVKLLRVLQEGAFEPVGSDKTVSVDVRIIAATNLDLDRAVEDGTFREDLYYRLHVFPLGVPPLRERVDDLPGLVERILELAASRTGRGPWTVSQRTMRKLGRYDWPGNVRELVNTLERARVLAPLGGELEIDLPERSTHRRRGRPRKWVTLREHESSYIEQVLTATKGRIYGPRGAASLLGMPPTTLQSRLRRLGIDAASFRDPGAGDRTE